MWPFVSAPLTDHNVGLCRCYAVCGWTDSSSVVWLCHHCFIHLSDCGHWVVSAFWPLCPSAALNAHVASVCMAAFSGLGVELGVLTPGLCANFSLVVLIPSFDQLDEAALG